MASGKQSPSNSTISKLMPIILGFSLIALGVVAYLNFFPSDPHSQAKKALKLYWFIPDGMRADPNLFNVYKWAEEGKLPNIKKLMERGSYGFIYPNFPSHTPTNFAALLTGTYPEVNGIDDGPMREVGKPLDSVAVGGFRSTAKKVAPIWKTLEEAGMKVGILSVPGSTPPEVNNGVVIRGRWGGWGFDTAPLIFETKGDLKQRVAQGRGSRLFFFGPQLTNYLDPVAAQGWSNPPESFSPLLEVDMKGWGADAFALVSDSTDDGATNYDTVAFSLDKENILASLKQGEWSEWSPITLKWVVKDQEPVDVASDIKFHVIKLDDDGFFRLRLDYNELNQTIAFPPGASDKMNDLVGPMIDFVDNFPAQLIYYPEDKKTFLDEANMSFDWHTGAVKAMIDNFTPNVVIHDIYTPNQMLTSRWWMGHIDPASSQYDKTSDEERNQSWEEVMAMYQRLDKMIGEIIDNSGPDTYIVLSSDHGAVPLNTYIYLNNLFAQKGWLKFTIDPNTGEPVIDWANSKVIYLKMAHVYINPNGLDGDYVRASGPEYEALRNEVINTLKNLTDEKGVKPVVDVVKWEDAKEYMLLDPDRIGDLVIANAPGYGWNEEMTSDLKVFNDSPQVSGYKQAILAKDVPGMWTPFIIAGPGIKKNNYLGDKPISIIDQYPTIMKALKVNSPDFVQGKVIDGVFR